MWGRIINSLAPRGVFVGQLFGDRDSWNILESGKTFHTEAEALALFAGMEMLKFVEEEDDKKSALGHMKHFHVFHFIARKA